MTHVYNDERYVQALTATITSAVDRLYVVGMDWEELIFSVVEDKAVEEVLVFDSFDDIGKFQEIFESVVTASGLIKALQ